AIRERVVRLGLEPAVATHLEQAYGAEALAVLALAEATPELAARLVPNLPYLTAEVVYACQVELALTLDAVLAPRIHMAIEDAAHGLGVVYTVASIMARELGWSDEERARQIAVYAQCIHEQSSSLTNALRPTSGGPTEK